MPRSRDDRSADRPRATIVGAFVEAWRRVLRAPALAAAMLVITLLMALPLSFVLRGMLEDHLGSSLEGDRAAQGWNAAWAGEFEAQAQGLGRTFNYEILGFGGTLANISRLVDRERLNPALAGAVTAYVVLWIFVSGGLLDRLARARPIGAAAFFAACGVYFGRFLRLGVIVGAIYWMLFRWLHPFLFVQMYDRLTRDLTSERTAFWIRLGLYVIFLAALAIVSLIADFAKVRAVVEDRRSMIAALAASGRFIRRRVVRVTALYLLNVAAFFVVLTVWLLIAPSASASVWWALLVTQMYLLARIWVKLAFMTSEVVFFQSELAHAEYTSLAEPVWPDSPAVEAIARLGSDEGQTGVKPVV